MYLKLTYVIALVLISECLTAGFRSKRDNTYGDELVTPAGGGVTPVAVSEQSQVTVSPQGGGAQANVETSGYRKRRNTQNSYGDETVISGSASSGDTHSQMVVEHEPATVEQAGGSQSAVQSSGY